MVKTILWIKKLSMKQNVFYLMSKKYLEIFKISGNFGEIFKNKIKQLNEFYIPLAETIYTKYKKNKKVKIVGLTGGQGVGKSTISQYY